MQGLNQRPITHFLDRDFWGVVAPPWKPFPNWTTVTLSTTHDWQIKFKQATQKHSSEQLLYFPIFKINRQKNLKHFYESTVFHFYLIATLYTLQNLLQVKKNCLKHSVDG